MTEHAARAVVFTDLDGTLLDRTTYSYDAALPAVELLLRSGVPIVFCSAKTRAEQKVYRSRLGIGDPFIVENGGGIFIPQGYFPFDFERDGTLGGYAVIELGMPYRKLRAVLERLRAEKRLGFKGFGDMRPEEVASVTGLDLGMAHKAKQREYTETLILDGTPQEVERALGAIEEAGLTWTHGGNFYEAMGGNDKGRAASILISLLRRKLGRIQTIGLGDSLNDQPLLAVVDTPVLVQKPQGEWEKMDLPGLHRVDGIGPVGWKQAIYDIVGHLGLSEE
ncbi:MAG: mannosyl-3-phosphoglycerate phosphatase [Dehalococcoidia bacterium]